MDALVNALGDLQVKDEKAELLKALRKKLLETENPSQWVSMMPSISQEELNIALTVFSTEFEDFVQRTDFQDLGTEADLQYSAKEKVAKRCIQIQILIMCKNFDEVSTIVTETYHLIQHCITQNYFSEDYAKGFRFVVRALEISWALDWEVEKLDCVKIQQFLDDLDTFDDLSTKNKVGVFVVKQVLIGNLYRTAYHEQIDILKEMIKMDPENPEWSYSLYEVWKFLRESQSDSCNPYEEEKEAIVTGMNHQQGKQNPRVRLGYAYCLAEILKGYGKKFKPFWLGDKYFSRAEEATECIRRQVEDILAIDPMSVRSNINIAKIYSSVLPPWFRNESFAVACIKRALLFNPQSSKANHRMAIYYLGKNLTTQALKYLQKAFSGDERNFHCLTDLLRTCMGDCDKNRKEIDALFEKVLNLSYYKAQPKKLATILFTKAIYKFLDGQKSESVESFMQAYTTSCDSKQLFKEIERHIKRYKWRSGIISGIRNLLRDEHTGCSDQKRKDILKQLYDAAQFAANAEGTGYSFSRGSHSGPPPQRGGSYGSKTSGSSSGYSAGSGYKNDNSQNKDDKGLLDYLKSQDHWSVLGIAKGSSRSEIKKAYRSLAKANHPDKNQDLPAEEIVTKQETMKKINKAYEALCAY